MAVRKKADAPQAEQNTATDTKLASLLSCIDKELELKTQESAAEIRKRVLKEWLKGLLAFPVAIAGAALGWSVLKSSGFAYWLGTISGLVIMSIGMAYGVEFIKLLISGDLTKATMTLMRRFEMKEWMRVFLAFLSIGAGICIVMRAEELTYYFPEWMPYCIGIVLIAGGITYFWSRSKFCKG
jgi:hypothetical protein